MGLISFFQNVVKELRRRQARIEDLPLLFEVDVDDPPALRIRVYSTLWGTRSPLKDICKLWYYGTVVENDNKFYTLSLEDCEILLAIRTLNPLINEKSELICEFSPEILAYLRSKGNKVQQTERAAQVLVLDGVIEPAIAVEYQKELGLVIKAGYFDTAQQKFLASSEFELHSFGDREYLQIGTTYHLLPRELKREAKQLFEEKERFIPLNKIPDFFKRDLVLLKTQLLAVLTEEASKIKVLEGPIRPRVSIRVDAPGWLDFNVDYVVDEDRLVPEYVFKGSQTGQYAQLDEYTWWKIDQSVYRKTNQELSKLGAIKTETGYRLPIMRFSSLEEFIEKIGGVRVVEDEYRRFLGELEGFEANENFSLPDPIEATLKEHNISLRPYQRAGIHWLTWLRKNHLHGILADDMGLGKTMQTIIAIRLAYMDHNARAPSLVICPKSVMNFWARELDRCFPGVGVLYHGPNRDKSVWLTPGPKVYITSFEVVVSDLEILQNVPFYFVVVDEASFIKNPDTQRAKAIKSLNAVHRIALTGTPIENRPAELWSIFDFLMKGYLGSYDSFVHRFEEPLLKGEADKEVAELLSKRIRPFVLRRTKEEVAKDLPEKIEMEEWCELTPEQRRLYVEIQRVYAEPLVESLKRGEKMDFTRSILPIITKLKQVCDHPALIDGDKSRIYGRSEKFDLAIEKIFNIVRSGESTVVFSHFLGMLDLFQAALEQENISFIRIQGDTQNRGELIDDFNAGKAKVALCSLRTAGHGITLTAANHVIHVDRWWNPAVENQATDRVHRIGQEKTVYVYRILTRGTLEERICKILEKKQEISDTVVGSLTSQAVRWTREEIIELLNTLD